jgi:hypothetical protein
MELTNNYVDSLCKYRAYMDPFSTYGAGMEFWPEMPSLWAKYQYIINKVFLMLNIVRW